MTPSAGGACDVARRRVHAGVRDGGQFTTHPRPESPVELPTQPIPAPADPLEGNCWDIPAGTDTNHAVAVGDFPVSQVSWWSVGPGDETWCRCGRCPSTPTLADERTMSDTSCEAPRIAHYAACIEAGDEFPPIHVLHDSAGQRWGEQERHLLVDDGFHRISAYRLLGRTTIPADLYAADHGAALAAVNDARGA